MLALIGIAGWGSTPLTSTIFIRDGFDIPGLALAWLGCRSLLAGEAERAPNEHVRPRLQAGSYKR